MNKLDISANATHRDIPRHGVNYRDTQLENDVSRSDHFNSEELETSNAMQNASSGSSDDASSQSIPDEGTRNDISRQTAKQRDASRNVETYDDTPGHVAIERDASRHDAEGRDLSTTVSYDTPSEPRVDAEVNIATSQPGLHNAAPTVSVQPQRDMKEPVSQKTQPAAKTPELDSVTISKEAMPTTPAPKENWLDIEQAAKLLREHGISRTGRTIQRLCKKGDLDARLVPTENASRYIINERSIEALIKRYNETLPSTRSSSERDVLEDTASSGINNQAESLPPLYKATPDKQATNLAENQPTLERAHMQQIVDLKDQQINMLQSQLTTANNQITVKDEQIATMLERDHETNVLIQNLQQLVALPEGRNKTNEWRNSI